MSTRSLSMYRNWLRKLAIRAALTWSWRDGFSWGRSDASSRYISLNGRIASGHVEWAWFAFGGHDPAPSLCISSPSTSATSCCSASAFISLILFFLMSSIPRPYNHVDAWKSLVGRTEFKTIANKSLVLCGKETCDGSTALETIGGRSITRIMARTPPRTKKVSISILVGAARSNRSWSTIGWKTQADDFHKIVRARAIYEEPELSPESPWRNNTTSEEWWLLWKTTET